MLPSRAAAYTYSEDEGKWVVRGKVGYSIIDSNEDWFFGDIPFEDEYKIFDSTLSGEAELDYFLYDHFSIGASAAYMPGKNGTWVYATKDTSGAITTIPLAITGKYHFAPYGEIRPYITAGYNYTIFRSSYEGITCNNTSGPLVGVGTDWWFNRDWGLNFEAKQYFIKTTSDWSKFTGVDITTKVDLSPIVLSAGVAYRF